MKECVFWTFGPLFPRLFSKTYQIKDCIFYFIRNICQGRKKKLTQLKINYFNALLMSMREKLLNVFTITLPRVFPVLMTKPHLYYTYPYLQVFQNYASEVCGRARTEFSVLEKRCSWITVFSLFAISNRKIREKHFGSK